MSSVIPPAVERLSKIAKDGDGSGQHGPITTYILSVGEETKLKMLDRE